MLYGAVKDNFGHYYKLHLPTDGRIPAGVQSRQFNDPVSTKQFIRGLEAQESHWRYLTLTMAAHISPHISIEEAICQLLIDGRIQVFDVTDYAKCRHGSAGAAFKTNGNTHVQVLPASAQLMLNNTARCFESVEDARAYLTQLNAPQDQLQSLARENKLIEAGSDKPTADALLDKLAQAIAGGKLIIVETKPNNAPAKKSSEEFLEVHDRLPGNRRPTLGPHVGAGPKAAPVAPAAIEKSAEAEENPVCSLSQFELKCSHGSRGYALDVIGSEINLNDNKGIQVISKHDSPDEITITVSGNCVNGETNCPSVTVSGGSGTETISSGGHKIKVEPRAVTEQVTSFMGFVKKYMVPDLGRMQYQLYRLTSNGCSGCASHSAIIHAFPTYKWSGSVGFGYRDKEGKDSKDENNLAAKGGWFLDAGLSGNIHKNTWNFDSKGQSEISDYFPALKEYITEFVEKLDDIANKTAETAAESGGIAVGGDALKFKVAWPKVTLGGGGSLQEVKGNNTVDLEGNLKLSMSPLLGLDIEADIVDWLMWNAGPHGELIRAIRNKIKDGIGTDNIRASADISVKLKMKGRVDVDFEWKKTAGDTWQITKGDGTGETAAAITVGMEGKAVADTQIFMVKIAIGITVGIMGANSSSEGIGVGLSLFATTKADRPAIGGEVQFTGVAVYYTYYAEASVKEAESKNKVRTRSATNRRGVKKQVQQETQNKFVLLNSRSWPKNVSSKKPESKQVTLLDKINI